MNSSPKIIVGRNLRVDIPRLGLKQLYTKVDTGAYRSSLHCEYAREITKDGVKVLEFQPIDSNREICYYNDYSVVYVMSSIGEREERFCVDLEIIAEGRSVICPVTLSNRYMLKVDLLLGRTFLYGNFLVDAELYVEPKMVGRKKT